MTSPTIKHNLEAVQERIALACRKAGRSPHEITLIAVSKTVDAVAIHKAYNLGLRNFGENRVQEAEQKIKDLSALKPAPTWHMIGHLQSNKVNTALDIFSVVQSIDSLSLAKSISKRVTEKLPVLLQVNIAEETTKNGFSLHEFASAYQIIKDLPGLEIKGLMTIAPASPNPEAVRPIFKKLREMRDTLKLEHLSMGMTDDFEIAIEEGSTMVRIGRAIFGERHYL